VGPNDIPEIGIEADLDTGSNIILTGTRNQAKNPAPNLNLNLNRNLLPNLTLALNLSLP
jgi:hypothetical protein